MTPIERESVEEAVANALATHDHGWLRSMVGAYVPLTEAHKALVERELGDGELVAEMADLAMVTLARRLGMMH